MDGGGEGKITNHMASFLDNKRYAAFFFFFFFNNKKLMCMQEQKGSANAKDPNGKRKSLSWSKQGKSIDRPTGPTSRYAMPCHDMP
jgi:hypothetical protein